MKKIVHIFHAQNPYVHLIFFQYQWWISFDFIYTQWSCLAQQKLLHDLVKSRTGSQENIPNIN